VYTIPAISLKNTNGDIYIYPQALLTAAGLNGTQVTPHLNIQSFTGAHMGSLHFHCYLCCVGSYHCPYFCAGLIYLGYAVGNIQLGNSNMQSPTVHAIHFFLTGWCCPPAVLA